MTLTRYYFGYSAWRDGYSIEVIYYSSIPSLFLGCGRRRIVALQMTWRPSLIGSRCLMIFIRRHYISYDPVEIIIDVMAVGILV